MSIQSLYSMSISSSQNEGMNEATEANKNSVLVARGEAVSIPDLNLEFENHP